MQIGSAFRNYINLRIELIDFYATNDRVCKVPTRSLSAWPLDMILLRAAGTGIALAPVGPIRELRIAVFRCY